MGIVEVTGGVDTHADFHVAAAVDANGGVLDVERFPANAEGYGGLLAWLAEQGQVTRVGVEGTGSYGVGLARFLIDADVEVVEVDRQNRQIRRKKGKSDPTDAVTAARAALSGAASVVPKLRNGPVEQMRVLLVARRSARLQRSQTLSQLRHLVFTAPEPIRVRFKDRPQIGLVKEAAAMRPNPTSDPVTYTTNLMIRNLARRIRALTGEVKDIDRMLRDLVEQTAPELLDVYGVGPDGAATLLVTAGDNPERIRSERSWAHLCGVTPIPASSGKTVRHRLNRGGDRHANSALHRIVLTRMSNHPETRAYVARRRAEGLNSFEIMRCLKRYVARQVFKHLPMAA
jgi:transposase